MLHVRQCKDAENHLVNSLSWLIPKTHKLHIQWSCLIQRNVCYLGRKYELKDYKINCVMHWIVLFVDKERQ